MQKYQQVPVRSRGRPRFWRIDGRRSSCASSSLAVIASTRSSAGCRASRARCCRRVFGTWKTQGWSSGYPVRSEGSGVSPVGSRARAQDRHRVAGRVGRPVGLRRAAARGVGRGIVDLEDPPANQPRAAARQADGGRVRLHGSSRATGVAAARASRGFGLRDSPRVRFRSHRPGGSGALLSCLVGTDRVRRRHSLSLGGGRRASRACEPAAAVVHVEPDGAFRSRTRATVAPVSARSAPPTAAQADVSSTIISHA